MYYKVRGIGSLGVLADLSPYEVPANGWTEGENIRLDDLAVRRDRGYREELDLQPYGSPPVHLQGWYSTDITTWALALADGTWFRYDGTTLSNISPAVPFGAINFPATPGVSSSFSGGVWYSEIYGDWLMVTNKSSVPHQLNYAGSQLEPMDNWPSNYLAGQVVAFNGFLFAVSLVKDGNDFASVVKWSDVIAPDDTTLPDWTIGEGSLAGEAVLDDEGGGVHVAMTLGQSLILYGLSCVWRVDPSGNPDSPWTFRKIFSDEGIVSPRGVANVFGRHLVVGSRSIYVHSGTPSKVRLGENKIESQFYRELGDAGRVQISQWRNEAVIAYTKAAAVSGPYQALDRGLVYNVDRDQFTFIDLPGVAHITPAPMFGDSRSWPDLAFPWSEITWTWDEMSEAPTDGIPLMCSITDQFVYGKDLLNSRAGAPVPVYLANRYMDLDVLLNDHTERPRQIRGIMPQFKGRGTIQFRIGTSDQPGGAVNWAQPVDFVIGQDYKVDFRQTGRYLSLEILNDEVDSDWYLTGYDIDIQQRGRR